MSTACSAIKKAPAKLYLQLFNHPHAVIRFSQEQASFAPRLRDIAYPSFRYYLKGMSMLERKARHGFV